LPVTAPELTADEVRPRRQQAYLAAAIAVTVPGVFLRVTAGHLDHAVEAVVFGVAIVGAAFLLSWAAETAQLDISAGLALAVLALIAVLPEYAVDLVFAGKAGNAVAEHGSRCVSAIHQGESPCSLALANMTGSNRLLIGVGWSMVVGVAWLAYRRRGITMTEVTLERSHSVELAFLAIATIYSLTLPFKKTVTLVDAVILVALFVAYIARLSRAPASEPHLVGPAKYLGTLSVGARRIAVLALLIAAATVILLCAERFAEALVATGAEFGISEFLLVQWLAPLASEAPELLVAGLYAWRLNSNAGLGTLVSAKVNQWTLLVGTLPIVFAITSGSLHGLPLDTVQREELLLTAAQSVFAMSILANRSLGTREALALFGLFWAQFVIGAVVPESAHGVERVIVSGVYLGLGLSLILRDRASLATLLKDGLRTPIRQLTDDKGLG
jgi:cation:H+ antiporter